MIVQITGKVTYPITLDPTVWIFDDRKLTFSEIFEDGITSEEEREIDELREQAERFNRAMYQQKVTPPVNKSVNRYEKERAVKGTFLMPLLPFLHTSDIHDEAKTAVLETSEGEKSVTAEEIRDAYALFAEKGKPLKDDGPIHLYMGDGSNKDEPIKGIKKIRFE
ncbi:MULTISPECIES: hypothetical protein [Salimicrobium]|uniref:Peptidyl-prolyl cis-trans isomerase n=1 Tax=Salimicrobium humidisoli TaxID=2029857 RepID=A0ABX4HQS6_9BACI|nr:MULTISPECIES: hypothetical protein [Salimicrobium]PBB05280.1 hypothetical protein CKW00_09400 [Salimicrobium humidisoli]